MSSTATQPNAVLVDTLADTTEPLSSMSSISPLIHLLTLAFQIRKPEASVQERLITLMHTMSASAGPSERRASTDNPKGYTQEEVHNSFIGFLIPVLSGMAGLGEFEAAVSAFSQPEEFRDFWNIEGRNLIAEFVAGDGPGRVMKGSDIHFEKAFVKDANCRVALGKENRILILVPRDAEVGDGLWWQEDERQLTVSSPANVPRRDGEAHLEAGTRRLVLEEPVTFNPNIQWDS